MFSAGPGPIKGGVYAYICDAGLDPVVPALVRGGVSVGVASRTVGEPGSFAGVFREEELESVFLRKVVVAFEEGEAESPRLKKLSESTVNESALLSTAVNLRGRARSYLEVCGGKASSRLVHWGSRRRQSSIIFRSNHVHFKFAAKRATASLIPEVGGSSFARMQPWNSSDRWAVLEWVRREGNRCNNRDSYRLEIQYRATSV
jgi:hypothetical protein